MNRNTVCPICEGAVPSEEHKGRFPGALSRFDNNEEICSACGTAEAMTPMFSVKGMSLMRLALDMKDFEMWAEGVRLGLPAVHEMLDASRQAQEQLRGLNEES